jgi:alpha-mannosidase
MYTLHLVSHTHWDREWYLTFQQFRLKLITLVDGLLEILDNDPEYKHFMLDGQTIILDDYLEIRPERREKLAGYIRSGRIIIGPWHILPDEFLVSPEATIRNLLQGDKTCRDFGPKMEIGYIPDPFGHIGQMPQILNGFGIQSAVFRRGLSVEPCELWWQAPDGSRVFTSYLRDGYDNAAGLPISDPSHFGDEVCALRDSLKRHSSSRHLLLMHGTDHMLPLPGTSEAINSAKGKLGDDQLLHSTLQEYITNAKTSLVGTNIPTMYGELRCPQRHHLLPGVLSTRMWIKQRNHSVETLLEKWVEPFGTFAQLYSGNKINMLSNYDPILNYAWRLLMENHPHDSICGCSIDQVHEEMKARFDQVEQIGEEIVQQCLAQLVDSMDTKTDAPLNAIGALVVFNTNQEMMTGNVTCEVKVSPEISSIELVDGTGQTVPFQMGEGGSNLLIDILMDRKDFAAVINNIHDGRYRDLSIQNYTIERKDETVEVNALVAQNGTNPALDLEEGADQIKSYVVDPAIKTFHILVRNLNSNKLAFNVTEVPGIGWKTIWICPKDDSKTTQTKKLNFIIRALLPSVLSLSQTKFGKSILELFKPNEMQNNFIENEFFNLKINGSGAFSLLDKRNGHIFHDLNRFIDGGDRGDEYNYCPLEREILLKPKLIDIRIKRENVQQSLKAELVINASIGLNPDRKTRSKETCPITIYTTARLTPGVPRVDIHTEVINYSNDHRLRVHFPFHEAETQPNSMVADYDGHFEVVRRSIGVPEFQTDWVEDSRPEVPQRCFTDISNGKNGLMLSNRGLPEVEVIQTGGNTEIALTLMRCVGWLSRDDFQTRKGHAGPFIPTPGAQMHGKWEFDYSIIPHTGFWNTENEWGFPSQQAYQFNAPLLAIVTKIHEGVLQQSGAFVKISPETFVISCVKRTRDQKGWLVRGCNLSDKKIEICLSIWKNYQSAWILNLAEEKSSKLIADNAGNFYLEADAHKIVCIGFFEGEDGCG